MPACPGLTCGASRARDGIRLSMSLCSSSGWSLARAPPAYAPSRSYAGVAASPSDLCRSPCYGRGDPRIAMLAAFFAALWPLSVYYGQVARMYALAALPALAAAWFILRNEARPPLERATGLAALSTVIGLYTLYYTVWALGALWLYAALRRPRISATSVVVGVVGPGGVYAVAMDWRGKRYRPG